MNGVKGQGEVLGSLLLGGSVGFLLLKIYFFLCVCLCVCACVRMLAVLVTARRGHRSPKVELLVVVVS